MTKKYQEVLMTKSEGERRMGSVVRVKMGYYRNYLLPKGSAVIATKHHLRRQEELAKLHEVEEAKAKEDSARIKTMIEAVSFEATSRANASTGDLYGSVGVLDLHSLLAEKQIKISKSCIKLPKTLKQLGKYDIAIRLPGGVETTMKVEVISDDGLTIADIVKADKAIEPSTNMKASEDEEAPASAPGAEEK